MSQHADPWGLRRIVVGVVSWVVLGLAWWAVLRRHPDSWLPDLMVPVIAALIVTPLTLAWVRHNRGIYERKGPRRGVPAVDAPWTTDSLGVPLEFSEQARHGRLVRLTLVDGVKRYEVVQ